MEAFSTDDIFKAVHQNHAEAANRVVLHIPVQPNLKKDAPVPEQAVCPEDNRIRIPRYAIGTAFRFAIAAGFVICTKQELIAPKLGAVLCMAAGIWAVCYWAEKRWNL